MKKFLIRFLLLFLTIVIFFLFFLSYFGLETNRFDNLIKEKANNINQNVKLDFENTKIHLNISELNLVVKLSEPRVLIKNSKFDLSKLNLFLSIKSFFNSDFLLERTEVTFIKNDIKDLTKITNVFLPKIINRQFTKIFRKGYIDGEFIIPFEKDGSIGKNYGFAGKISDATINLSKEFLIKDLTTEINHLAHEKRGDFFISVKKGLLFDLDISGSTINLKQKKNKKSIKALLNTKGKINYSKIKKIATLFSTNINYFADINGNADLKTTINFDLNNKFKAENISILTAGDIHHLAIETEENKFVKKYLPEYNPKIILKDIKFKFTHFKSKQKLEIKGMIKADKHFDNFEIIERYNNSKKTFDISGNIDLTNTKIRIPRLNYYKDYGKETDLSFDVNFLLNKYYNIKKLGLLTDKTRINLSNIKLNKNFETIDLKKVEIKTFFGELKNNDFVVDKSKKIIIYGEVFDAQPLLKSLYKKTGKKIFSKKFNSDVEIKFDKTLTGTDDDLFNFSMIASIDKGSFNKLSLKGNFSKDEIIEMSIYQIDNNKKTVHLISDRARPFVKNFKFIKGFEEGKLEYESIISKESSNSNLKITDFKVSKVSALAQLLTLASLQGIADTLNGEGIRFDTFEMQSISKGNWMDIKETYASGPAVSILLDGYIDKGKVVSLRGTLVPARTLNSIISSIPLVGEILVGKKTGEGVFGVSFKMKGPPSNLKTSVNPIKTLTPRFIVRAIEKMKKQKAKSK